LVATKKDKVLRKKFLISVITILTFVLNAKSQDTLVSAFFGLDNALPGLLAGRPGILIDGMPVNFRFPLDSSSLSVTDFEVVDSLGNIHIPMNAVLSPANENGENRTVLLLGEFGTAVTNPPVEVRVVGDLFTIDTLPEESAYSEIINLNGITTTNIIPLADGPSLFFAQRIDGNLNECNSGTQTIQVAWNGGITPYVSGDTESDLFQYYTGYSDSSGVLTPHVPISIADIDDTDNFHQLCFSTSDEIIKISMKANTVKDPNHDPNLYSEIYVSYSYSLSTSSSPSNSGTVSGDGTYNSGSTISISATPSNGYQFSHWSGDAYGSSNPLSFTINQDTNIVANFSVTGTNNTSDNNSWSSAVNLGNGWKSFSWFGEFFEVSQNWIYHAKMGWLYRFGDDLNLLWFYSPQHGWLFTSKSIYPYLYAHNSKSWLYWSASKLYIWNNSQWDMI